MLGPSLLNERVIQGYSTAPTSSNVNDIETKAKRSFDPPNISISNRNKLTYSKFFGIKEDQTNLVQKILKLRKKTFFKKSSRLKRIKDVCSITFPKPSGLKRKKERYGI